MNWYTLHITFPADDIDEPVRIRDALRHLIGAQNTLLLTCEEDWDAVAFIGDRP